MEDGVSPTGTRPTPADRPASRPAKKDEVALETYEQPAARGGGDDDRSGLSRRPDNVERSDRGERTARDEPWTLETEAGIAKPCAEWLNEHQVAAAVQKPAEAVDGLLGQSVAGL